MHPRWASLVAWQSSKPKAQTSHRKTPAVSHLDPSRLQPQQTTVPSLFPEPPLPCAYPPAEPTEVQEDGSHTGPQTRERGKTTGEWGGRHQADKFIFATSPFLFVCSDAGPDICTNQMEEAAISRKKKKRRGGGEEVETEGIRLGLFALKLQTVMISPQPPASPALPDRALIQERAEVGAGVRWVGEKKGRESLISQSQLQ